MLPANGLILLFFSTALGYTLVGVNCPNCASERHMCGVMQRLPACLSDPIRTLSLFFLSLQRLCFYKPSYNIDL